MTDPEALHALVCAYPLDDAPRLEYANAVRYDDPARRDFIEAQIEYHRKQLAMDGATLELSARIQVLSEQGMRWADDIRGYVSGLTFYRGFVEHISIDAEWFTESAEELYRLQPVLHVDFEDANLVSEDLFRCPHLDRIVSMSFLRCDFGDAEAEQLAASPWLSHLEWLDLSHNHIGPAGLEAIAASPHLPKLGYLCIDGNDVPDPTPRFADEYDTTSAEARRLVEAYGPREWLDARPRWKWPPSRYCVYPAG